ncbi:cytochrome-c peroxidase [Polyangium fumosum]|uniref:cytochrome-c peroxidase n=1 Tax=Polyangium fumosum TaxID=889272 RepID=UPI0014786E7D|nr:cytochrome c peroxidase [Polyangium fumosum]
MAIPAYTTLFEAAFGAESVNATNLAKALAAFERTLVPRDSSFDRYMAGDDDAMTTSQIRGLHGFISQGCSGCHSGPMLSDYKLHNLKVPARIGETGYGESVFPEAEGGAFRTPSLRMVTRTAPYMHNGVFETLSETVDFYHNIDHHIKVDPLVEGDVEVAHGQGDDILVFFEALSDGTFDRTIPERVPSGLPPAGGR